MRYAPFILGPAGGGPGVGALPLFWGSAPVCVFAPILAKNQFENVKRKKKKLISEILPLTFSKMVPKKKEKKSCQILRNTEKH